MENETVSIWDKKQTDVTVGDSIKIAVAATVITTAAAFGVMMIAGGAASLYEKYQSRKQSKLALVDNEG